METRKLQQVGGGTYTVSIPKEWAVEHGLEAGARVHLFAHADGSIVVRSSERDEEGLATVRVDVSEDSAATVQWLLRAATAVGYDTATLVPASGSFGEAQLEAARTATRHLVGTELVTATEDEITVRTLLDAGDVSIRQSLVQLRFVAVSAHRRATAAFVGAEDVDVDRLRERAEEAERLHGMIARHFSRSLRSLAEVDHLGVDRPELFDCYASATGLRAVARLGVSIGRARAHLAAPPPDPVAEAFGNAADGAARLVEEATTAVVEPADPDQVQATLAGHAETSAAVEALEATAFEDGAPTVEDPDDVRALTRAIDALEATVDRGSDLVDVALRGAL